MQKPKFWILSTGLAALVSLAATAPPPNLNKALEAQRALTVENPADDAAINDLGNLLRMAGRLDEAETAYRAAIVLAPEKVAPRYNLGILLQQRGKTSEALDQYRKVTDLDPGFAWAHYQIGALLEAKGSDSGALKAYTTAFVLDPELAFPQVNPQVIDNKLLQQALLSSYKKGKKTPPPQAPNTYADPKHIASLFVPATAQPAAVAETPAAGASPDGMAATRTGSTSSTTASRGGMARPLSPGAQGSSRVLSEDSLDDSQVGQVGGGKTAATSRAGGGMRATGVQPRPGQPGASTTQWNWPRNNTGQSGKPTTGGTSGNTFAPPVRPGGGRQPTPTIVQPGGFRPGPNSTGRLENRLLPDRLAPERAS